MSKTFINLNIEESGPVAVLISDIEGNKIFQQNLAGTAKVSQRLELSTAGFKPGIYCITLHTNSFIQSKKLVVVR